MPKTPGIILKNMLSENTQYELLDIYRFKNYDLVRVKEKTTNKVYIVRLGKHITDLVTEDDYKETIKSILDQIKSIKEKEKQTSK